MLFFLKTLNEREYKSGYSEMLKHGLIAEEKYFFKISSFIKREHVSHHIKKSLEIKSKIVKKDMNEFGFRKILNFGHTLGHAIETYFLLKDPKKCIIAW
jgi:3-dehydroquinate synthase